MEKNLKKILPYIVTGVLSALLLFIIFNMPYASAMNAYGLLTWGVLIPTGFLGFLVSLLQFWIILDVLLMIACCVFGILKELGKITISLPIDKINFISLIVFGGLSLLLFLFDSILGGLVGTGALMGLVVAGLAIFVYLKFINADVTDKKSSKSQVITTTEEETEKKDAE